ncbi:hypothetical protein F2P81_010489 [Scophthalmus maximus]|uniref:Uncharacterized protein n=1 Tax=Scophthalmus maximus TaxID=52904 RepID=A0A6A4SXX8_SCOMX|nr:hypothetical protein F2P81_010489 [Scophthalmus maximus]
MTQPGVRCHFVITSLEWKKAQETNMSTFWQANLEDGQRITPNLLYSRGGNALWEILKSCGPTRRTVSDGSLRARMSPAFISRWMTQMLFLM